MLKPNPTTRPIQEQLDEMVYQLYGLGETNI